MENLEFDLPFPPAELSPNARKHWSVVARTKKAYRAAGYFHCKQALAGQKPDACRVLVGFTFYPPDSRRRDKDNLLARMKAGIDGIADALGIDDKYFDYSPWRIAEVVELGRVAVSLTFLPQEWTKKSK